MGDPDFSKIPVAQLIDKRYGNAWRETIPLRNATPSADFRRPSVFSQLDSYASSHPQPNVGREPDHTTHYSVVDAEGNAVSVTTTLNDSFGSHVTAEGLGFLLNDEMDDFSSKPGVPNMYGLIQGPANAIGPGKRPLSAMTPTIVLKDGKLFLVLGSPGGPTIITTVANVLMGVVDYGLNIQQAVNAPRFHNQWMPDKILVEPTGISPDTIGILERMGHKIDNGAWILGRCRMHRHRRQDGRATGRQRRTQPGKGGWLLMRRAMSTLIYARSERLHPGLLDQFVSGGAEAMEIFAARGHFNYHERQHVREIANWFRSTGISFHSMHAPMYSDDEWGRGGVPAVNIAAVEKRDRIAAMDEIKRAIEVAEQAPFRFLIQHVGVSKEEADPHKTGSGHDVAGASACLRQAAGRDRCWWRTFRTSFQPRKR